MCGISGIIKTNYAEVNISELGILDQFLQERGPDNSGVWTEKNVGFSHTRLSIIDLDPSANQPMLTEDENYIITFNGEIYNFQALRETLHKKGFSFQTNSDTEVLLKGYQYWGLEELLTLIEGMFAFAIYDKKKNEVFFVRDRFGQKPLYYYYDNDIFIFSSDIRSIWKFIPKLSIDYASMDYYLSELAVPQPKTIWKEVKQIEPGHFLKLELDHNTIQIEKYWEINYGIKNSLSLQETIDTVEEKLTQAILKRTISDVPLGCFLSGGVDSGLIVSILANQSKERIKTFSVGLAYDELNELPEAKIVADRYDTDHTEIIAEADVIEHLPGLIKYMGEPFGDSSVIPSFLITREIKKKVTVALSGDGGDELFGGYFDYGLAFKTDVYLKLFPNEMKRHFITLMNKLQNKISPSVTNYGSLDTYNDFQGWQRLYRTMGYAPDEKYQLYDKQFILREEAEFTQHYLNEIWHQFPYKNHTDTLFHASFKTRLLNEYLVKVDRSSMLNSLEVRSPFMDHELAEFSATIPNNYKFHNGHNKYILKQLAAKYIDPKIFERKKMGFGIPIEHWLRNELKDYMRDYLLSDRFKARKIFNPIFIENQIKEHINGTKDHSFQLWNILCLEVWMQEYLD